MTFRNAVSRADKKVDYTNYLRQALLTAKVPRGGRVFTGHYHTGKLYRSIKHKYDTDRISNRKFSISLSTSMEQYGYELSEGYISEPVPTQKLRSWVSAKIGGDIDSIAGRINASLARREPKTGSKWIEEGSESYVKAFETSLRVEAVPEVVEAVNDYLNYNLKEIFKI
ncbi:MAG: hypothetical protein ACXQTI_03725 [Candidatus Nezhaarchaeales archaeon]